MTAENGYRRGGFINDKATALMFVYTLTKTKLKLITERHFPVSEKRSELLSHK